MATAFHASTPLSHLATHTVTLPDGQQVTLRPWQAQDDSMEGDFIAGLPPLRSPRSVAGTERRSACFVASIVDADGDQPCERVIADARWMAGDDGRTAQFGLVVADPWAGRGLGRRLLALLVQSAQRAGMHWLYGEVPAGHAAMLALAAQLDFGIEPHPSRAGLLSIERSLQTAPTRTSRWAGLRSLPETRRPATAVTRVCAHAAYMH